MDEIGVLRESYPAQSFDSTKARMAARKILEARMANDGGKTEHRPLSTVIWNAKFILVAVVVAAAAFALVPVGGASLGARGVDGIVSLWDTQDALDAAAEDARSIAGSSYFTAAALNQDANTVDVYLKSAPQSVIDQLTARHPGVYVIHNDAPNTEATLLKLTDAFDKTPLQEKGIRVTGWGPTRDGYLQVGVTADVATAQSILDKLYGPNVIRVYQSEPALPA